MNKVKKTQYILKPQDGGVYAPEERAGKLAVLLSKMNLRGRIEKVGEHFHITPDEGCIIGVLRTFAYEHGFDLVAVNTAAA